MSIAPILTATVIERPPNVRSTDEQRRARHYPLARWWLRPLAGRLAATLRHTPVRPWHLTLCGLAAAASAAGLLVWHPAATTWSAALVLAYWFCDRADGQLARLQSTSTRLGAWLDANVDELADVGLHLAVAYAATAAGSTAAGPLVAAFLAGKYLLMYGLNTAETFACETASGSDAARRESAAVGRSWLRWAYHLPGNADVRLHLLALALLSGWLTAELALVAVYYNLRWIARYGLVVARSGAACP